MEFHHPVGCGRDRCETDHGHKPFVAHVVRAVRQNQNFRTAFWTGDHLQMTLMSIPPCGEIGVEMHPDTDQFIRVENGQALVHVGACREKTGLPVPPWCGGCAFCTLRYMAQCSERRKLSAEALICLCAAPTSQRDHTSHKGGCRRGGSLIEQNKKDLKSFDFRSFWWR